MARCSAVWPSLPSAAMTSASVFQSLVFSSFVKSWSSFVGLVPSKSTRTLSFFFTLFSALEFPGEKIIHHQRRDKSGHAKILLRVVIQHMQAKFITSTGKPRKELVYRKFLFVGPLGNCIQ